MKKVRRTLFFTCLLMLLVPAAVFSQNFDLAGYATQNGGTSGGAGGSSVTVSSGSALNDAIQNKGSSPLTIYVSGRLTFSEGRVVIKDVSDISIIGQGNSAELDGFGLSLRRAHNIIIRNLKIHHVDSDDKDAIQLNEDVTNVWVDHCELYSDLSHDKDYYDGLLDITHACDYVTVSWNVFHTHFKGSLIGHSDNNASEDTGHFLVTYHHNYFYTLNSRAPSIRFGRVHLYNNYYRDIVDDGNRTAGTAISSRCGAIVRIERNYFESVDEPIMTDQSDETGYVQLIDNRFVNCGSYATSPTSSLNVPYSYSMDSVDNVPSIVSQNAGVGIIDGGSTSSPTAPPTQPTDPPATPEPTSAPVVLQPGSTTTLQAEDGTLSNADIETEHSGYTGSGYVNFVNEPGGYIEWTVSLTTSSQADCVFVYANGGDGGRAVEIRVNNNVVSNLDFPTTSDWTSWSSVSATISLNAGTSVIRYTGTSDEGGPNVDRMDITVGGGSPTSPPVQESPGDVNGDNSIDIIDALLVAQYYVGLNPNPFNINAADVTCDGEVDIVDALRIAQYYVGLVGPFSPCN